MGLRLRWFLVALTFILGIGCSGSNTSTSTPAATGLSTLTITPNPMTIAPGSSSYFSVIGGTAPYNWYLISGVGSIGQTTALYTAPSTISGGTSATVEVTDSSSPANVTTVSVIISSTGSGGGSGGISPGGTIEIYQLYKSSDQDYMYSTIQNEGASDGYVFQQNAFQAYQTQVGDTVPMYRCRTTSNPQRHYLTLDGTCGGNTTFSDGIIAYIFPPADNGVSGGISLYQFISPNNESYYYTVTYNNGLSLGYTNNASIGYAFEP